MHILGINLPDNHFLRFALTRIYGIGDHTAHRVCARLMVHDRCKVKDLTPSQITSLSTFLSSPSASPQPPRYPLASPNYSPPPSSISTLDIQAQFNEAQKKKKKKKNDDRLRNLKIESELRNEIRENIGHHRMIGSYVGRRHAMNLPVRGQNTQNNAQTAKKLNKLDRW